MAETHVVLADEYETGRWSMAELAKKYHIGIASVWRQLHEAGVSIRPAHRRHTRTLFVDNSGYLCTVGKGKNSGVDRQTIHRACWEAYHGTIPAGCVVHHADGNKLNNEVDNLECLTRAEHMNLHREDIRGDSCCSS